MDYKGIFMPEFDDILLGNFPSEIRKTTGNQHSKNTADDVDEVMFSLHKFVKMACDGETTVIDMLHCNSENLLASSDTWEELVSLRSKFYTKNMKAFLGYCRKQAAKYGLKGSRLSDMDLVLQFLKPHANRNMKMDAVWVDLVNMSVALEHVTINSFFMKGSKRVDKVHMDICGAKYDASTPIDMVYSSIKTKYESYGERALLAKKNEGIDWKALSHAMRAAYQLSEIYISGDLKYPLDNREYILAIKQGKLDYTTDVAPQLEAVIRSVETLAAASDYPQRVDTKWWDRWLIEKVRGEYVPNVPTL
jgi:hypothetical protein